MESPTPDREAEHAALIESLLEIARAQGFDAAVKKAKKEDNPHILDDLHARLAALQRQQSDRK